jgi:hypothetical protein
VRVERGRQVVGTPRHRQAGALELVGEDLVRRVLLEAELGLRVDLVRHLEQLVGTAVDLVEDPLLQRSDVHPLTLPAPAPASVKTEP